MGLTNFPNGVASFGMPVLGGGGHMTTGNVFFVDSTRTNASDGNLGNAPDKPFATLDAAIGACTANNGDVIFVQPGHSETLVADSGVNIDVAGVTVIGLGEGSDRPTFNFTTATTADFKMNVANGVIHNLLFTAGIISQAMFIEVSGDDCEISHCEFRNDSSFEALIAVNIGVASNDSDRFYIHDCRFISDTANSTSAISMTALQAEVRIEDNYIRGDYSDSGIQSAVIHTDVTVKGNFIQNDNAGEHGIQFSTTGTGLISNNVISTDVYALTIDAGSCAMSGNRWLDPAVDTGDIPYPAPGIDSVTAGALPVVFSAGERFFVDSGHSDASDTVGYGTSPAAPFAKIDFANTQCTSANGDVIYAMAGHVETVTNGTDLNFDVIGVTVIGLGTGRNRPLVDFTTADDADAPVSVANVHLKDLRFAAITFDSNTAMITITGADVTIENCEFEMADGSQQADSCITTNSDRTRVLNCNFIGSATPGNEDAIEMTGTPDGVEVIGCKFTGDFTNAAIQSAVIHTNCIIRDNFIENLNSGDHAIQFSTTSTGWIEGNNVTTDAYATAIDPGSCKQVGNWFHDSSNTDTAAMPIPAGVNSLLGIRVDKADFDTPNAAVTTIFTVSGGRCMITRLQGIVGTVISAAANATKITANPTTGGSVDLTSTLDINGFDTLSLLGCELDGTAMLGTDNGAGGTLGGIGISTAEVAIGAIDLDCAGTTTGTTSWSLWYWPMEEGAQIVSA